MGAKSVTGTGVGVAGINRGPGNNRNQFYSMVDPHVIWHGTVEFVENVATVYLPSNIVLPPERLTVLVAGKGWCVEKVVTDGIVTAFTVVGSGFADFVVVDAANNCFCSEFYVEENFE